MKAWRWLFLAVFLFPVSGFGETTIIDPDAEIAPSKTGVVDPGAAKTPLKTSVVAPDAAVPPAELPKTTPLQFAQVALPLGIQYLRNLSTNDVEGWFLPPHRTRRILEWKKEKFYYKEVMVDYPVYEYETYETLLPGGSPTDPLRKVTASRVKRQIGTEKRKVNVRDPKGPIAVEENVPVYSPGGPDQWDYGRIGLNAMALFALVHAGVPTDDSVIITAGDNLGKIVEKFGPPDNTFDTAWMTAAFAVLPGDRFSNLASNCASKIVDGQVRSGPGCGLWGPVLVNAELFSVYLRITMLLSDKQVQLEARCKEMEPKPVEGRKAAKPSEALAKMQTQNDFLKSDLRDLRYAVQQISWYGMSMFTAVNYVRVVDRFEAEAITGPGVPYLFHNQAAVDLESTSLALFALRVAAERGRLPAQTFRPELTASAKRLTIKGDALLPLKTIEAVNRAVTALEKLRNADGAWDEANLHQPSGDFLWLRTMPVAAASSFVKLPSPVTVLSTVQGAASLRNAKLILKQGDAGEVPMKNAKCTAGIRQAMGGKASAESLGRGTNSLYAALFNLTGVSTMASDRTPADPAMWNEAVEWLFPLQNNKTGTWGIGSEPLYSSCIQARINVLPKPDEKREWHAEAHVAPQFYQKNWIGSYGSYASQIPMTSYAIMFLADGAGKLGFGIGESESPVPAQPVAAQNAPPAAKNP